MTTDTLRDRLPRRPFDPFPVMESSGSVPEVQHPENAVLMRNGLLLAYGATDGGATDGQLPDRFAHLSMLHIAAIETVAETR